MDNTGTSNNDLLGAQTGRDRDQASSPGAANAAAGGNTLNRDARSSKEYLEKYGLIQKITQCEYQQQELVEKLDDEADFENKIRKWGLTPLRTKTLDENQLHRALLLRLIRFNDAYKQHRSEYSKKSEGELTKAEVEKMQQMTKKKRIFQAMKDLMQKLIYTEPGPLLDEQILRVKTWLEEKILATQAAAANAEKAHKAVLEKKRQKAQEMARYSQGHTKLPDIRCRCGQSHDSLDGAGEGPMGTLSLSALLQQSEAASATKARQHLHHVSSISGALRPNASMLDYPGSKVQSHSVLKTAHHMRKFDGGSGYHSSTLNSNALLSTHQDSKNRAEMAPSSESLYYSTITINKKPMGTAGARQLVDILDRSAHSEQMQNVYASAERLRERSIDMKNHEISLHKVTQKWGRGKTAMETDLIQCRDRALEASNFQDLGIRSRLRVLPPAYQDNREFLDDGETSDEDRGLHSAGGLGLRRVVETNEEAWEARHADKRKDSDRSGARSSMQPVVSNFESSDLLCRVRTGLKLPIDENPSLMKNYMHKRMANQVKASLNTKSVENTVERELRRRRIANLRCHHQQLLGVKKLDRNATFNGLSMNGPVHDEAPTKKKAVVEEVDDGGSSEEEITNATTFNPLAISLSIYDDKNLSKKKFQKEYYSSPAKKTDPVQSRNQLVAKHNSLAPEERALVSNKAIQPPTSAITQVRSRFGLHLAGRAGNVSGLHINEEEAELFKLPKNTQLCSSTQLKKVDAELGEALEAAAELEAKTAPKKKAPAKDKKPKKGKGEVEEEAPSGPPPEPSYFATLKGLIRSERFEVRQAHLTELEELKAHLNSKQLAVPAKVLQKALFLPEDEEPTAQALARGYPRGEEMLMANPDPKPAKKKKGGKKKK